MKRKILGLKTQRNTIRVDNEWSNGRDALDFMFPANHDQSARHC
jgi:hypothetical protein